MSIKSTVTTALNAVSSNSWAVELPVNPAFPAIVFDIDSRPEDSWVIGGGYDQHTISVVILAKTLAEIQTLLPGVDTAIEGITGYMTDGERGDADYEDDASVYAYFVNHVVRTPRY